MIDAARDAWPDWLGGAAFIAPPVFGAAVAAFAPTNSKVSGVAGLCLTVSLLLIEALTAPLVGYRRRYVLWSLVPFWGLGIAWRIGTRLARLTRTGSWETLPTPVLASHQP